MQLDTAFTLLNSLWNPTPLWAVKRRLGNEFSLLRNMSPSHISRQGQLRPAGERFWYKSNAVCWSVLQESRQPFFPSLLSNHSIDTWAGHAVPWLLSTVCPKRRGWKNLCVEFSPMLWHRSTLQRSVFFLLVAIALVAGLSIGLPYFHHPKKKTPFDGNRCTNFWKTLVDRYSNELKPLLFKTSSYACFW